MEQERFRKDEIELIDYIEVMVRRRWTIFVGTSLVAVLLSLDVVDVPREVGFRAEANLLVIRALTLNAEGRLSSRRFEPDVLRQFSIARRILGKMIHVGRGADSITVRRYLVGQGTFRSALDALSQASDLLQDESGIVTIRVEMKDSITAAVVANAYLEEFVRYYSEESSLQNQRKVVFLEERLASAEAALRAAEDTLIAFKRRHRGLPNPQVALESLEMELSWLQRKVGLQVSLCSTLLEQYERALLAARMDKPSFEILNRAYAETAQQTSWNSRRLTGVGIGVGFVGSILVAFVLEYFSRVRQSGGLDPILEELGWSKTRRKDG